MQRVAFTMQLKKGCVLEYKKRHDEIWPELANLLKANGISEYSIFVDDESGLLFAVQKQNGNNSSQNLGSNEIVQRWWKYMADLMETNSDNSPVCKNLREVFWLE